MTWRLRSRRTLLASVALAAGVLGIAGAVAQRGGTNSGAAHIPNQPQTVTEYQQGEPSTPANHIPNQPHNVAEYQQTSAAVFAPNASLTQPLV